MSRTTLYTQKIRLCIQIFFFKKSLFEYENQFAIEKKNKKKFWGQFQKYFEKFFCRRHQKMLVIQLILLLTYLILLRGSDCVQGLENSKSIHKVQV